MNDHSPFDETRDVELGAALQEALALPFGAAFVNRVRARLNGQRQRRWEDELAGWFWQGLVAASLVTMLAGWGLNRFGAAEEIDQSTGSSSVASQLLEGSAPGTNVLFASMTAAEAQ